MKNFIKSLSQNDRFKRGGYVTLLTIIVLAVALVVNLIVGELPSNLTEIDISSNAIYEVSITTKEYLSALDKDVQIILVAQESFVDPRITKFLDRYKAASSHLSVEIADPVVNPSVLTMYNTTEGNIVVKCADTGKQTVVSINDIITYDYDAYYTTGQISEKEFDGDGQITSAVDFVTGDATEIIYTLTNHGEGALPTTAKSSIEKANLTIKETNLLIDNGVAEDCSLLISYAPISDLSDDELTMLTDYLAKGGQLMLLLAQSETDLPNWTTLMQTYGITPVAGFVGDTERYYTQMGSVYAVFPVWSTTNAITSSFGENDLALLLNTRGFNITQPTRDTIVTESIFNTSATGVVGQNENAVAGTYVLGAVATETVGAKTARFTVFGTANLINDNILSQFSNLSNLTVFMNAATAGLTTINNISVPAKSLAMTGNTVVNAGMWGALLIFVIPIIVLVFGFLYWNKRRKQ